MKRILLNAAPLVKGGALQACVAFIRESLKDSGGDIEWHYVVSEEVAEELLLFGVDDTRYRVISPSPSRSRRSRQFLVLQVNSIKPDAVFTFFGPTCVTFNVPHLMGFADGWLTHANWLAIKSKGGLFSISRLIGLFVYKRYWAKKADAWVVEADCAKSGIVDRFGAKAEKISVVPNTCAEHYLGSAKRSTKPVENNILVFSSYYPHKNFEIIPDVARKLLEASPQLEFKFVLTLSEGPALDRLLKLAERKGVGDYIENFGPISLRDGPALYRQMAISFLPTLLETSTAVYPESMASGVPIVTSDLDFAHNACDDSALYFKPHDANGAAENILMLLNDKKLYVDQVDRGYKKLSELPSQAERYRCYKAILLDMLGAEPAGDVNDICG